VRGRRGEGRARAGLRTGAFQPGGPPGLPALSPPGGGGAGGAGVTRPSNVVPLRRRPHPAAGTSNAPPDSAGEAARLEERLRALEAERARERQAEGPLLTAARVLQ